jgi:hypothetical protein
MAEIELEMTKDKRQLFVGFKNAPDLPFAYIAKFTAGFLDDFLQRVGLMRTGVLPAVPKTWAPGQTAENAYRNPAWLIETDQLAGDALLHIRDERFGWLHFIFGKAEAAKLSRALADVAAAAPPAAHGSA